MSTKKLEYGFLFSYDWLPAFEPLSGDDFKELFLALMNRQRYGEPFPAFKNEQVGIYADIFANTIDRRLSGKRGGEKAKFSRGGDTTQGTTQGTTQDTTQANKDNIRKDKIIIEERERNTLPPSRQSIIEELKSEGIPAQYIEERYSRAIEYSNPVECIRSWWAEDREKEPKRNNFETDSFFDAALRNSYSDKFEQKGGEA